VAAVACGWGAAIGLDRALPVASGAAGAPAAVAVATLAALVTFAVVVATGYLPWREARALVAGRN
jgi:hypothetical protein